MRTGLKIKNWKYLNLYLFNFTNKNHKFKNEKLELFFFPSLELNKKFVIFKIINFSPNESSMTGETI